jgi:transposase
LATIASLTERTKDCDRESEGMAEEVYPETALPRQVRGVGSLSALAFVLALGGSERFAGSRDVGAYPGLVPESDRSGDSDPEENISKHANTMMRKLSVGSARYILGPFGEDRDPRRHGEKIASRGGKNAKKRAVVAVARKLSVSLRHPWSSAEVYDPLYNASRGGGGAARGGFAPRAWTNANG